MSPEEKAMVKASLKSLRRYVIVALAIIVLLVAAGIATIIIQNASFHEQLVQSSNTTHGLLHSLQSTLTQDKCEIIHGAHYPCPLPK